MLLVAKIGRLVGVNGALKLHIMSDFPSIFVPKATFHLQTQTQTSLGTLCIHTFNPTTNLVTFEGYESRESAAKLVNCELYSTLEESKQILKEGEILWQELINTPIGTLCIHTFNPTTNLVTFEGYESRESAAKLVNCELYSTLEESKQILKEGEILWQELINTPISDTTDTKQRNLGVVKDIERIGEIDYFLIRTHTELVSQGLPKQFYIPNISQYVLSISTDYIATQNAFLLLQES